MQASAFSEKKKNTKFYPGKVIQIAEGNFWWFHSFWSSQTSKDSSCNGNFALWILFLGTITGPIAILCEHPIYLVYFSS